MFPMTWCSCLTPWYEITPHTLTLPVLPFTVGIVFLGWNSSPTLLQQYIFPSEPQSLYFDSSENHTMHHWKGVHFWNLWAKLFTCEHAPAWDRASFRAVDHASPSYRVPCEVSSHCMGVKDFSGGQKCRVHAHSKSPTRFYGHLAHPEAVFGLVLGWYSRGIYVSLCL